MLDSSDGDAHYRKAVPREQAWPSLVAFLMGEGRALLQESARAAWFREYSIRYERHLTKRVRTLEPDEIISAIDEHFLTGSHEESSWVAALSEVHRCGDDDEGKQQNEDKSCAGPEDALRGQRYRDQNGWTPLHFACQYHSVAVIEHLLARGADAYARDDQGWLPLEVYLFRRDLALTDHDTAQALAVIAIFADRHSFDVTAMRHAGERRCKARWDALERGWELHPAAQRPDPLPVLVALVERGLTMSSAVLEKILRRCSRNPAAVPFVEPFIIDLLEKLNAGCGGRYFSSMSDGGYSTVRMACREGHRPAVISALLRLGVRVRRPEVDGSCSLRCGGRDSGGNCTLLLLTANNRIRTLPLIDELAGAGEDFWEGYKAHESSFHYGPTLGLWDNPFQFRRIFEGNFYDRSPHESHFLLYQVASRPFHLSILLSVLRHTVKARRTADVPIDLGLRIPHECRESLWVCPWWDSYTCFLCQLPQMFVATADGSSKNFIDMCIMREIDLAHGRPVQHILSDAARRLFNEQWDRLHKKLLGPAEAIIDAFLEMFALEEDAREGGMSACAETAIIGSLMLDAPHYTMYLFPFMKRPCRTFFILWITRLMIRRGLLRPRGAIALVLFCVERDQHFMGVCIEALIALLLNAGVVEPRSLFFHISWSILYRSIPNENEGNPTPEFYGFRAECVATEGSHSRRRMSRNRRQYRLCTAFIETMSYCVEADVNGFAHLLKKGHGRSAARSAEELVSSSDSEADTDYPYSDDDEYENDTSDVGSLDSAPNNED